jgi:hypothetical protein
MALLIWCTDSLMTVITGTLLARMSPRLMLRPSTTMWMFSSMWCMHICTCLEAFQHSCMHQCNHAFIRLIYLVYSCAFNTTTSLEQCEGKLLFAFVACTLHSHWSLQSAHALLPVATMPRVLWMASSPAPHNTRAKMTNSCITYVTPSFNVTPTILVLLTVRTRRWPNRPASYLLELIHCLYICMQVLYVRYVDDVLCIDTWPSTRLCRSHHW